MFRLQSHTCDYLRDVVFCINYYLDDCHEVVRQLLEEAREKVGVDFKQCH